MKDIFSNYFKVSTLMSIVFLIFGLLLFFNPEGVIVTISLIIGIIAILFGCFEIILYTKINSQISLVSGVFSLISGIVLIVNTSLLATIIPIIIGCATIMQGIKKIDIAATLKSRDISSWGYMLTVAILNLMIGIILILNPIMGAVITTQIIGIIIIIYTISSLVDIFIFKKDLKKISNVIEEIK